MTDEIKRRTIVDISPDDVGSSYTDSTFNAGSPTLGTLTGQDTATFNSNMTFHPGAGGVRTTPNEGGYAYSDTPEATVFIQKRQWIEDDWTYVTNRKERSGKIQELLLRIRIGNMITRKLDWLNDHEVFTKVSKLNSLITANALDLSGSQVTRYYTETLDLSETTTTKQQLFQDKTESLSIATVIEVTTVDTGPGGRLLIRQSPDFKSPVITGLHGPYTGGPSPTVRVKTTGKSEAKGVVQNVVNGPNSFDSTGKPALDYPPSVKPGSPTQKKYPSAEWWEIDLSSIAIENIYPEPSRDLILKGLPDRNKASAAKLKDYIKKTIQGGFNSGKGYVARVPEGRTPQRQYATAYQTIEEIVLNEQVQLASAEVSNTIPRVYNNVFNGVIELANITSINTTISNNTGSPGIAQLTLMNPNNVLTISDEDIDIALGENPLLDSAPDEFGNVPQDIVVEGRRNRYYRGRYYTDRAYQLVTRQDLGAIGNVTNSKQIEDLKKVARELTNGIRELEKFKSSGILGINTWTYLLATKIEEIAPTDNEAIKDTIKANPWLSIEISTALVITLGTEQGAASAATDKPLGRYPLYLTLSTQITNKISSFKKIIIRAQQQVENLINAGTLVAKTKNSTDETLLRNQVKKYFQNRTIFQVLDRVFIWMTSPSRTEHTLENGTPVAEEFTVGASKVKRIQDIVALIQQLENIIQTIAAQLPQEAQLSQEAQLPQQPQLGIIFKDEDLKIINQQLYESGSSQQLTQILGKVDSIFKPTPPTIKIFKDSILQKVKELGVVVKSQTKSTSIPGSTDTSVQGVDPAKLFAPSSYLGYTDRQFQVFQGVITRISRSYNNGSFTLRIDCADNLYFLQRSRYISVPGLNGFSQQALAVLDDPIWRQRDAFLSNVIPIAGANVPTESYFGKWKTGQLTLTTSFLGAKEGQETAKDAGQKKETTNTSNVHSPEVVSRAFGRTPQSENEPFDGADPANIISVLTCGVPFDLAVYLENTIFKGSLVVQPKLQSDSKTPHSGEALAIGPFELVRQEVSPLTKKYGNFQPYLLSETPITPQDKIASNLATKINLAVAIMQFYKNYIAARKSTLAADVAKDQQKTNTPNSPFKQITEQNVDQVVPGDFPASAEQIKLGPFQGQIDRKAVFIILCAIYAQDSSRVNKALSTGAFLPEEFKLGTEDFSSSFKQVPNRALFALSGKELGLYAEITRASADRVSRGAVFRILLDKEPVKKNYSTPQSPSIDELVGANASNPSSTSLKAQRDAKLHPINILQATKESIIHKIKPNFLVVSDRYFTNTQLVDYVRQIGNAGGAFNDNQYTVVLDRCVKAANAIDWEFYADSQGHLQFKPPTYNRTQLHHLINFNDVDPIYIKLMVETLKKFKALDSLKAIPLAEYKAAFTTVKQVYKSFIINQLETFKATQLRNAPSSLFTSTTTIAGLGPVDPNSLLRVVALKHFGNGRLFDISALIQSPSEAAVSISVQNNPRSPEIKKDLDPAKIPEALNQLIEGIQTGKTQIISPELAVQLAADIMAKQLQEFEVARRKYYDSKTVATSNENETLAQAAAHTIEVAIQLIAQAQLNLNTINEETAKIEKDVDAAIKFYINPDKIHVISSAILLSEDWEETEPAFTRLNITSAFAFTSGDSPEDRFMHWAGSVDYDLWRIYGYKEQSIQVPFLQTAAQVAVYGDLLMARQYAKILRGSITVRGDSKYQLGDCVYIEDENLYYYITSINHQFAYGQGYTTNLTLEYGRRPGYLIPYPFEVLGSVFTRGANVLYTGSSGDKISSAADLNNLLDLAWQKDVQRRKSEPDT